MPEPELFVPTEAEAHLMANHNVASWQIVYYRRHCKENNIDYDQFLETNHALMHPASESDE